MGVKQSPYYVTPRPMTPSHYNKCVVEPRPATPSHCNECVVEPRPATPSCCNRLLLRKMLQPMAPSHHDGHVTQCFFA